ncbi:hypothetical protein L4F34_18235 [Vibrio paracholerae]|nr:hypothetical protein [Vibrio paracholerae]
MKRQCAWRCKF